MTLSKDARDKAVAVAWNLALPVLWTVTSLGRYLQQHEAGVTPWTVWDYLLRISTPIFFWIAAAGGIWRVFHPRPPGEPETLSTFGKIVQTVVLVVFSALATDWAIQTLRAGVSNEGASPWLFSGCLALSLWYVTLQVTLRAFLPALADRLRPKRPTEWRVVGDFRLPVSPMFWIDVTALASGAVLAAVGTRFWPVAVLLVLFGVLRLGDRFDVFGEAKR